MAGIRAGKTAAGVNAALWEALRLAPGLGWIIAPDWPMLRDTTMREFFRWCPRELIAGHQKSERRVTLWGGAQIQFKSAHDPDKLRGADLNWFWLDEGALCPAEVWDILAGRVLSKGGRGMLTTTPKGQNWVYDLVMSGDPDLAWFTWPSRDSKYLSAEMVEALARRYGPTRARQELEASFEAFAGRVFPQFALATHVGDFAPDPERPLYGGVDFGFVNPTVCIWAQVDAQDRATILDEYWATERTAAENARAILAQHRARFGNQRLELWADPEDPAAIEEFRQQKIPISPAPGGNNRRLRKHHLEHAIMTRPDGRPGFFVSRNCSRTIASFLSLRYRDDVVAREEDWLKENDHPVDACAYLLLGYRQTAVEEWHGDWRAIR